MPSLYRAIVQPVITEKSSDVLHSAGPEHRVYTFRVHPRASKQEIRQAIERLWEVTVEDVRTLQMRAKLRRKGRTAGRRAVWKKAIVRLARGDTIEGLFEG